MKNLVTAADITSLTAAGIDLDPHLLEVTVPDATQRHLRPLLGLRLFDKLLAFAADAPEPPTPTGQNRQADAAAQAAYATELTAWRTTNAGVLLALWDQLKSCLAQWALVEAWPALVVRIKNAGPVQQTGNQQGTTVADPRTMALALTSHRDTAIWRGDELVRWVEGRKSDYPDYVSTNPPASGAQPGDWFGGINV